MTAHGSGETAPDDSENRPDHPDHPDNTAELTVVPDDVVVAGMVRRLAASDRTILVASVIATLIAAAVFVRDAAPALLAVFLTARAASTVFSVLVDRAVMRLGDDMDGLRRMLGLMELAALLRAASWALLCMFFAAPVLRHPATVIGLLSIVALQGVTLLVTTFSRRAMLASLAVFWAACVGRMAMLHDPRWVQIALVGLVYQAVLAHFGLALHRQVTTSVRDELITDGLLRRVSLLHQRVRAQRDELAAVNQRLSDALQLSTELATRDHLTGVLNRRAFQTNLDNWISSVNGGRPAALLLIDLDHFKLVNDRHGHAVGDAVLRDCAAVLGGALRDGDVLARWGGEEFIALLPDTDLPAAEHLAQSARQAIAERIRMAPDWGTTVTVSVGVAVIDRQVGFDAAFAAADDALYLAKALGRDRVQVSTAGR